MDKAALLALAARCEAASGPDRTIDNAIADACGLRSPSDPAGWPPCYTAGLDCALSLVPGGWRWEVGVDGEAYADAESPAGAGCDGTEAVTPALALCAAALRARAALA